MAAELRALCEADSDAKKVVDVAKGLAGLRRQDGIHAAAVVITREPLTEYLPVQRKPEPGGDPADAPIVTQYEMHGVADLGLLKMDFLGLRNLTVIERALDLIEASTGRRLDIDNVDLEDERTFEMLRRATPSGCSSWRAGPCGRSCARWRPPASTTSPPWWPSTGPGPWRPTCTTTSPTARTGASRSCASTPTWTRSWPTPTG